jgi:hypothetical protein
MAAPEDRAEIVGRITYYLTSGEYDILLIFERVGTCGRTPSGCRLGF